MAPSSAITTRVHEFHDSANVKASALRPAMPLYVLSIDPENNRVVVGDDDALRTTMFEVEDVNWVSIRKTRLRRFARK